MADLATPDSKAASDRRIARYKIEFARRKLQEAASYLDDAVLALDAAEEFLRGTRDERNVADARTVARQRRLLRDRISHAALVNSALDEVARG